VHCWNPADPAPLTRMLDHWPLFGPRVLPGPHARLAEPTFGEWPPPSRQPDYETVAGRSGGTHTMPSLKPAEPIPNAALRRSRFTSVSKAVISTSWRSSK